MRMILRQKNVWAGGMLYYCIQEYSYFLGLSRRGEHLPDPDCGSGGGKRGKEGRGKKKVRSGCHPQLELRLVGIRTQGDYGCPSAATGDQPRPRGTIYLSLAVDEAKSRLSKAILCPSRGCRSINL